MKFKKLMNRLEHELGTFLMLLSWELLGSLLALTGLWTLLAAAAVGGGVMVWCFWGASILLMAACWGKVWYTGKSTEYCSSAVPGYWAYWLWTGTKQGFLAFWLYAIPVAAGSFTALTMLLAVFGLP